jgi:hypothetical protein
MFREKDSVNIGFSELTKAKIVCTPLLMHIYKTFIWSDMEFIPT